MQAFECILNFVYFAEIQLSVGSPPSQRTVTPVPIAAPAIQSTSAAPADSSPLLPAHEVADSSTHKQSEGPS